MLIFRAQSNRRSFKIRTILQNLNTIFFEELAYAIQSGKTRLPEEQEKWRRMLWKASREEAIFQTSESGFGFDFKLEENWLTAKGARTSQVIESLRVAAPIEPHWDEIMTWRGERGENWCLHLIESNPLWATELMKKRPNDKGWRVLDKNGCGASHMFVKRLQKKHGTSTENQVLRRLKDIHVFLPDEYWPSNDSDAWEDWPSSASDAWEWNKALLRQSVEESKHTYAAIIGDEYSLGEREQSHQKHCEWLKKHSFKYFSYENVWMMREEVTEMMLETHPIARVNVGEKAMEWVEVAKRRTENDHTWLYMLAILQVMRFEDLLCMDSAKELKESASTMPGVDFLKIKRWLSDRPRIERHLSSMNANSSFDFKMGGGMFEEVEIRALQQVGDVDGLKNKKRMAL
jgi:hypothetical protein